MSTPVLSRDPSAGCRGTLLLRPSLARSRRPLPHASTFGLCTGIVISDQHNHLADYFTVCLLPELWIPDQVSQLLGFYDTGPYNRLSKVSIELSQGHPMNIQKRFGYKGTQGPAEPSDRRPGDTARPHCESSPNHKCQTGEHRDQCTTK